MRLGIDLDGVVANFIKGWMDRYNAEFGTGLTEGLVDYWDAAGDLTHFERLEDFWQWAGAAGEGPTIFRNLETYPGALTALERLAVCHDIVILSMKPDWAVPDTYRWIADHGIPTTEVHFLRDKWLVDCDVYLDDSPFTLPPLVVKRPEALICRFVRPYNDPVPGAIDIENWDQFVDVVSRENGGQGCVRRT